MQTHAIEENKGNDFSHAASWERERSDEELQSFVLRRQQEVGELELEMS